MLAKQLEWLRGMVDHDLVKLDDNGNIMVNRDDYYAFKTFYNDYTRANSKVADGDPEIVAVKIIPNSVDKLAALKYAVAQSGKKGRSSTELVEKFRYAVDFNPIAKVVDMDDDAFEVILTYKHYNMERTQLVDDYIRVWLPRHTSTLKFQVKKR